MVEGDQRQLIHVSILTMDGLPLFVRLGADLDYSLAQAKRGTRAFPSLA